MSGQFIFTPVINFAVLCTNCGAQVGQHIGIPTLADLQELMARAEKQHSCRIQPALKMPVKPKPQ